MSLIILAGSYKDDIYSLKFDPLSNSLELISATTVGYHPSWITFHPQDRSLIFTGLEQSDGKIVAVKYNAEGKGEVVGKVSSGGQDPCSLFATADELIIANYSSGLVAFHPLSSSPPHFSQDTPTETIQLKGSGPNADRQESSHAHQAILHPEREELLIPDLGADKVWRLSKSKGKWEISGNVSYCPGGGPRHVAFHDGMLYTLLELTSSITSHTFPALPSEAVLTHTTSTLTNPLPLPNEMLAAEILVPKPNASFPEPYLYVSNRNDPGPDGDTIAIFSIVNKEKPVLVTEVPTGLRHVRGIVFGGPGDRWLVAGGVNGGGVRVFERTEGGKNLRVVAENQSIEAPTAFLWV